MQRLDGLLEKNIPVYITSVGINAYDPERKFSSRIRKHYDLRLVGARLYEDWHRGELKQKIFRNRLYRLTKKL
jgi:hypothetical protein